MPAAVDLFPNYMQPFGQPYTHAEAVTPSDTVDLTNISMALYVGTAGALTVITSRGETVAFGAVTAGSVIPIRVSRVKATGTAASNIVALS